MSIDSITSLLEGFDLKSLIPDLSTVLGKLELAARLAVMAGPLVLLGLGLWYYLAPPKEANHRLGYRTYFGMGSVEAWQFTQRLVGILWSALGLLLTVAMALICNGFRSMDAMKMAGTAVTCIFWELGLVLVSYIGIELTVFMKYDRDGNPRRK